jgi:hypothetical protein
MALFSLTDIKFNKGQSPRTGKTGDLVGGKYETNLLRYPQDLGNYDKGHYLVIHINEQEHTQIPGDLTGDLPTIIANRMKYGSASPFSNLNTVLESPVGKAAGDLFNSAGDLANKGLSYLGETGKAIEGFGQGVAVTGGLILKGASSIKGVRTIRRTTDTIALYMPDTMNFVHNQAYSDLSLTGLPAAMLAGGASAAQSLKNNQGASTQEIFKKLTVNMSPFIVNYAMKELFGNLGTAGFAAGFGMVQNPILELLYTSPSFRTFRFDFMMYPRSESEAREVQAIINQLKFHQAPEVRKESNGYFLIPPSEFDIKFYYNGAENPNIPKISTCVLESIDLDYAPNGFTTYEVPGDLKPKLGKTGMPVAIRMSLQFKETEIMTKDHFIPYGTVEVGPIGPATEGPETSEAE